MAKGMIIDVDHMSIRSIEETFVLAAQRTPTYPLVATHVQFFDLNQETTGQSGIRHERMRIRPHLQAIIANGGMIAAMTKDDQQDTDLKGQRWHLPYTNPRFGPPVTDDCRHSSKTFAQAYQYAFDLTGRPIAFGTDFNGVAGHVGPRFGSDACGGDLPSSVDPGSNFERSEQVRGHKRLQYPFTIPGFGTLNKQVTGSKVFDFNVDGLAHIGLLPDLVKDMETIGVSQVYIDALFNSAEEYVRMWERADAISRGVPVPTPPSDLTCAQVSPVPLAAAILPGSRSVQVGQAATAFATVINAGTFPAAEVGISLQTAVPATFSYQTTDPHTNAVTGTLNTPVNIAAGGSQTFVIALTPTAVFTPTNVMFTFAGSNSQAVPPITGVNTLLVSGSSTSVSDIVALGATGNADGIVDIPGTTGTGVFAVATVNVGASASITASADTGATTLPVGVALCQTDPGTGTCLTPPTSAVTTTINAGATPTFGVFVTGAGTVPFDPAANRVFVRFKDAGGVTRGSTSVAVRTQ
jgi:microsomal dipeptidase-like Zn-dependent dipeptidase